MDNLAEKRSALRELADDLCRWARACRDEHGPIQDVVLATVLDRVAADCEQLVVALTGKVTIDGIEHSDPDVIEKLEGR